ncbi:hypothetical protein FRC19_001777 [Serendipita sp. 401]|nr:hypothetical protein FRC19_001777 [Serendipita sp. 401]
MNRTFEYEFMHEELLPAYLWYIKENPGADTPLTRITYAIWSADLTLDHALSGTPRHYSHGVDALEDIEAMEKRDLNLVVSWSQHVISFRTLQNRESPSLAWRTHWSRISVLN